MFDVALTGPEQHMRIKQSNGINICRYLPNITPNTLKGIAALAPESVIVHTATSPNSVKSWEGASEWLPLLAMEASAEQMSLELQDRPKTVLARCGYLLQTLRPDIANTIYSTAKPTTNTWLGPRKALLRYNSKWKIADTLLPFDPGVMEPAS
jgi:hypothetical protein